MQNDRRLTGLIVGLMQALLVLLIGRINLDFGVLFRKCIISCIAFVIGDLMIILRSFYYPLTSFDRYYIRFGIWPIIIFVIIASEMVSSI